MTVKLSDLIDGFEMQQDESSTYLDKDKSELLFISEEDRFAFDDGIDDAPDWQKEHLQRIRPLLEEDTLDSSRYIALPDKFYFHEYSHMEEFVVSLKNETARNDLWKAIKGSGAFNKFRMGIKYYKLEDEWYKYRDTQLKQMLLDWCEVNEIEFVDDTSKEKSE